jgi:ribonuclease P protein component
MIILKKNKDYKSVYNCNNSISDYNLVLFIKKNDYDYSRFGFTAAKKIKRAVDRNVVRRRLKEIVRQKEYKIKEGYDIVLMARINSVGSNYKSLEGSFMKLMKRKNLFKGYMN